MIPLSVKKEGAGSYIPVCRFPGVSGRREEGTQALARGSALCQNLLHRPWRQGRLGLALQMRLRCVDHWWLKGFSSKYLQGTDAHLHC